MIDAANYSAIETLGNGKSIEIRALRPNDKAGLLEALGRESAQSLYRRFFAIKRDFTQTETDFFLNVDFAKHVALVALTMEVAKPTIVGGCRYVTTKPKEAEVAFSVVDEYQGQGLGTLLMRHLTAISIDAGFSKLVAEVLPENRPMLSVFEKCGHRVFKKLWSGVFHVTVELKT